MKGPMYKVRNLCFNVMKNLGLSLVTKQLDPVLLRMKIK